MKRLIPILLLLISSVVHGDDFSQSVEEYRKTYLVGIEVINFLAQNSNLAWAPFDGSVTFDYSVREQKKNLTRAKSKLQEFDRLLKLYSSLKVVSKDGVKHKSIMLDYFSKLRPDLMAMIDQSELILRATASQDITVLENMGDLWIQRSILMLENESAVAWASNLQIESWHPSLYRNLCIIAANDTVIEVFRLMNGMGIGSSQEVLFSQLRSAERDIRTYRAHITNGLKKVNDLLPMLKTDPEFVENPELLVIWEEIASVYVDSFHNESAIADELSSFIGLLSEVVTVGNNRPNEIDQQVQTFFFNIESLIAKRVEFTNVVMSLVRRS